MPELAEIRIYARNLDKLIGGREIEDLRCFTDKDLSSLKSRTVERVDSYGKGIYFHLRGGGNLYVHLMLTGGFVYVGKDGSGSVPDKMLALKTDGRYLIVTDPKRYAKIEKNFIRPDVPEAAGDGFTVGYFLSLLDKRTAVKNLLTDQSLIMGIGNAYADEILYRAGIHPFSRADRLDEKQGKKLYAAVFDTFDFADGYLRKYRPDMLSGEDRSFFEVHVRGAEKTSRGENISVITRGGRKTYFADSQVLCE